MWLLLRGTLTVIQLLLITLGAVRGDQVCYEHLGCFSDGQPWSGTPQRLLAKLPWTPEKINTQFFIWTRDNLQHYQILNANNMTTITTSSFRTSKKTVFIVHGMADRAENNWVSNMCQEMLKAEDTNCIGVDWRRGSGSIALYVQAANNARLVGAEIAYFIQRLHENLQYPLQNVHIIGHSLGAHAAGYAGSRCPGLRRITGLDPARPYFQDTPEEVHLDALDAMFVDIIHSDTGAIGAGMVRPTGHLDFYPNGGQHMTGCPSKLAFLVNRDILETVACNHFMAFRYYTYSIRHPGAFISYPCDSYKKFTSGSCFPCPLDGCPTMGHYAEQSPIPKTWHQKLYLMTGGTNGQYSSWRYKISVKVTGDARITGKIYISLHGPGGNLTDHQLKSGSLIPGDTLERFIDSPVVLHPIDHVAFHWTPLFFNLFQRQLGVSRVNVQTGEDGKISSFCSSGTVLDNIKMAVGPCDDWTAL